MPTPAFAQSAYDGLPEALRREVDARRRTMARLPRAVGATEAEEAMAALERIPEDIRSEPRPFGVECVHLVVTTLAFALGADLTA